ncbi:MAG TPA: DUF1302 domain-containing protein [Planctomycetes bacterium]|nr:DUF1302 domain-containing protein [Planctomycetota bacterium]HIN80927.1 DUF1302 domain-containing protein [Planctomycetota bacterium]
MRTIGPVVLRALILAALILPSTPLKAIELELYGGRLSGYFDTTISAGVSWRVSDRDLALIGVVNGGTAFSINGDDGNLNYDKGDIFSSAVKVLHEIDLSYGDFDFFLRGFYYYDSAVASGDGDTRRTPLTPTAQRIAGRDGVLLDAYVRTNVELGGLDAVLTIGSQAINWGESLFIQNGIATINPVDVAKLRTAGAQIKEAFLPVPAIKLDFDLTDNVAIESFYQLMWRKSRIEPRGTFFSTSDIGSPGAEFVFLGFGLPPIGDFPPTPNANAPVGAGVLRTEDREPSDNGQFGVAMRYFAEEWGSSEFGLYFTRLHSRLPLIGAITGSGAGLANGNYGATAEYFLEYPESQETIGLSVNTDLVAAGMSFAGEVSLHLDQPLQVDDVELLFAALSPLNSVFGQGQLGTSGFEEYVQGFRRKDYIQGQFTLAKILGTMFGADQVVAVGEFGATYINDFEDESIFRYEAVGTYTSGNEFFTGLGLQPATQPLHPFPDALSMGYRLLGRATYNNAFYSMNLIPQIAFFHDIEGTTPVPIANFVEDRKLISLSLAATYLSKYEYKITYTNSFGNHLYNLRTDRDYVSVTASYSF